MTKTLAYADVVRGKSEDFEKVGKVSARSVQKHTGKDWRTWVRLLDKAGARSWTHGEIVALLRTKYRLTPWWQQGVALGFQIATGRRRVGQDAKGRYLVTATKSLPIATTAVWKKLLSPAGVAIWLRPLSPVRIVPKVPFETKDGFFGEIRTMAKHRRIRMSWQDPLWEKASVVEVLLVARPEKKTILVFNHTGLPDAASRETLRARWREVADLVSLRACRSDPK